MYQHGEPHINYQTSPLDINDRLILKQNGYLLDKCIGEGSYATVKLVYHERRHQPLAVKVIQKAKAPADFIDRFLPRELDIMCKIKHPHIIALYQVLDLTQRVYIFMELAACGDLLDYIKQGGPLSDVAARRMFGQLVSALKYCHSLNIAHRDLKCENVLLDKDLNAKLTDFGFARVCTDEHNRRVLSQTYCGSSAYAAPEVLQGVPYNPKMYDIWSLGVILYIMVCGSMPFDDSNVPKMLRNILTKAVEFPSRMVDRIVPNCKILIAHVLEPDVTRRATIDQVINSRWMRQSER
ncbi:testis-specific serine/threonine-protein kinase 1-like [Watersipora subatra]|uniref:testis-specific serine/threonine-protein kinase 1-like n=1 Tax=Watersipora subatra TaxID=2589382 RepID=UPI00355B1605